MNLLRRQAFPVFCSIRKQVVKKNIHSVIHKNLNITSTMFVPQIPIIYNSNRSMSKKKRELDSDDEDEDFDEDASLSKDSKLVKFSTTSLRTDAILKSALGVARNKIEQLFYESKIRVNGKKLLKKSASVKVDDEIDVIKMVSPKNPNHLYIARVEIMNIVAKEESIGITARRFKNLLIENYATDPYKGSAESNE
ncbi:uncharacterized protein LOC106136407 [Amyelois transitella]|uniref:uncharacterized protein LOC106136407 n=1 Tax=Amyelois transitella TaxID=680683 RepID=UPI00067A9B00|nr:uncharacterized protein LOC106136407 [Amyelois transitella]